MIDLKGITIQNEILLSDEDYKKSRFSASNDRTMDDFTKKILFTARKLFDNNLSQIDSEKTGVVICTRTGAYASLKKTADAVKISGHRGINPSFFPNVMLSTPLSYLTMYLNTHGPSCVFYNTDKHGRNGLEYCAVQLNSLNAETMILICADENGRSEGKVIIKKDCKK